MSVPFVSNIVELPTVDAASQVAKPKGPTADQLKERICELEDYLNAAKHKTYKMKKPELETILAKLERGFDIVESGGDLPADIIRRPIMRTIRKIPLEKQTQITAPKSGKSRRSESDSEIEAKLSTKKDNNPRKDNKSKKDIKGKQRVIESRVQSDASDYEPEEVPEYLANETEDQEDETDDDSFTDSPVKVNLSFEVSSGKLIAMLAKLV